MYTYHPVHKLDVPFIPTEELAIGAAFHEVMEQIVFGFAFPSNFRDLRLFFGQARYMEEVRKIEWMSEESLIAFKGMKLLAGEPEVTLGPHNSYKGRIDLIAKTAWDEPVIIDWKTSKWDYSEHNLISSYQLISYADLYYKTHKVIPKIAYVAVNKQTFAAQSFMSKISNKMLENWHKKFTHFKEKVGHNIFDRNPNSCINFKSGNKCQFYETCWKDHFQNDIATSNQTIQPMDLMPGNEGDF
jgi:hypothetical protein